MPGVRVLGQTGVQCPQSNFLSSVLLSASSSRTVHVTLLLLLLLLPDLLPNFLHNIPFLIINVSKAFGFPRRFSLMRLILELREQSVKKLKQGILSKQMLDFTFKMSYNDFNAFLTDFKLGKVGPDPNMYLIHSLALCLYRPIIVISSLERHKDKKVIHFHENCNKPPIVLGLYQREEHEIYLPFYFNKNTEFKLENLKGKINIVPKKLHLLIYLKRFFLYLSIENKIK